MILCQHCVNKDSRSSQRKVPKLDQSTLLDGLPCVWELLLLDMIALCHC